MKLHRKPIIAVDSDRLVVFDDKMKEISFTRFGLSAISVLLLLFLTAYGCAVGLNTQVVSGKLESLDMWAAHPGNQLLIFFFLVGVVGIVLLTFGLWALWLRRK